MKFEVHLTKTAMIQTKKKSISVPNLTIDNAIIKEDQEKAEAMADYFSYVYTQKSSLPKGSALATSEEYRMDSVDIDEGIALNFQMKLDAGKSMGPDNLYPRAKREKADPETVESLIYRLGFKSGHMLAAHNPSAFNETLGTIEAYIEKRQRSHVSLLRVWESDDPHPQEDYLDCLWAQICNLRKEGWVEKVTWRLYDSFPSLREHGRPHKLAPLPPPEYAAEVTYPLPSVVFRIFDYTDVIDPDDTEVMPSSETSSDPAKFGVKVPVLPGAHTIERFLIGEHLAILMNNLSFNRSMWYVKQPLLLLDSAVWYASINFINTRD
ncbi:unnamed protein product [Trichobilharzia regenti]|nr:unnamed protein product [Trichobilharzia regenti]